MKEFKITTQVLFPETDLHQLLTQAESHSIRHESALTHETTLSSQICIPESVPVKTQIWEEKLL